MRDCASVRSRGVKRTMAFRRFIPPRRYRLADSGGLVRDAVPPSLRNRVGTLVDDVRATEAGAIWNEIVGTLGIHPAERELRSGCEIIGKRKLVELITRTNADVAEFCEVIEATLMAAQIPQSVLHRTARNLIDGVQETFLIDHFGFRVTPDGLIVDAGSEPETAAVDQARDALAADSRFRFADERFLEALRHATLSKGVNYSAAVHAAVSSVEETCRQILGDSKASLDTAIAKLAESLQLPGAAVQMVKNLYGLRSAIPGAGHGAGEADEHIARFAIHTSASAIVMVMEAAVVTGMLDAQQR